MKEDKSDNLFSNDEDLESYQRGMHELQDRVLDALVQGADFTAKLEIRGCKGRLLHCRNGLDRFDRPKRIQAEIEAKRRFQEPK